MKFSIIMQSLIADYPNSASDKPKKFIRAVNSVINQTYKDWELLIIADNCPKTVGLFIDEFNTTKRIRLFSHKGEVDKAWHSYCRNIGIENATGDYLLYLDIDDYYKQDYLANLNRVLKDKPLYFVDDITLYNGVEKIRRCNLKRFMCGTSNVVHKKCKSQWEAKSRYVHEDYNFIQNLLNEFKEYEQLNLAGYVVGHIPKKYDY